ncbi:MAG TPA: RecQ family ATP-dependent DNA helicase, partial [Thermodesulfobacteriota bacterium]|nr:RecQ family ATP-dependent DNA helicase [Thermodesulfobacteriota bacterium]
EWGHDFRPEYRQIAEVRFNFPQAVCIALTATATPRVQEDIKDNLRFSSSSQFIASFNRENLFIQIVPKNDPFSQLIEFLEKFPDQSGIIYCFSRKQVDDLYEKLENEGFSVKPYHAGLSERERIQNQESFIRDDVQIIIATIAFGMGINKPNVRFVVHYDLPKNIETYYQEIGRAGRDGLKAHCLLLFSYGDIQKIKYFINQKDDNEQRIANIHLNALLRMVETEVCRRIPILTYFGEDHPEEKCGMCDNCVAGAKELVDITVPAQIFLSCVKRTGEMFGMNHIINVLQGSQSQRVLKFGHQNLSTYGIGKEYSRKQWFHMSRQFIQKGLMVQDVEFGSLKLTKKAYDVFKGKEKVLGIIEEERADLVQKQEGEQECDRVLFEMLRKKRKELADEANLPPYVIFSDKTLIEMAAFFPQSEESLLDIHGVGTAKLQKFGETFLKIICQYCDKHGFKEVLKKRGKGKASKSTSMPLQKRKHVVIAETYNSGKSIMKIMKELGVKHNTVISHLYKYLQEENSIRSDGLLELSTIPSDQQAAVLKAFDRLGSEYLRPVFDALNGKISYDELRILHLYYLSKRKRL